MKTQQFEVLGAKFNYAIPETSGEINTLAGRLSPTGQLLDVSAHLATLYTLYHQVFGDLRGGVVDKIKGLELQHEGKPLTPNTVEAFRTRRDGTKVPYLKVVESDEAFVNRAIAVGAITVEQKQEWLQAMADSAEFAIAEYLKEPTRHARPSGPTRTAQAKVAGWKQAGTEVFDQKVNNLLSFAPQGTQIDRNDLAAVATLYDTVSRAWVAEAEAAKKRAQAEAEQALG